MHTLDQLRSGALRGIKRLTLSCGLTEFPREIFSLHESLEVLDLSNNRLSSLPDDLKELKKLTILFCSDNEFTEVPPQLSGCTQLSMVGFKSNKIARFAENALPSSVRWLILTNNRITTLPQSMGNLKRLQKCALAGNKISRLPDSMQQCRDLELLRISANQLTTLPPWLFQLPKLSWLAFSANPLSHQHDLSRSPLPHVAWHDLTFHEVLGEGASGTIYRGQLRHAGGSFVALKLFKGEVTSDGLPRCEMNAALAAGGHDNLIPVEGQFSTPQDQQGLILTLIPEHYKILGSPPDLESCTRDTFPENPAFSLGFTLNVLTSIARASAHLHSKGIMHGDLYAHNILVDAGGHAYLGDFGAATQYDVSSPSNHILEGIDVRAFGCLIDDMLRHLSGADCATQQGPIETLKQLRSECLDVTNTRRPHFSEIVCCLESIRI